MPCTVTRTEGSNPSLSAEHARVPDTSPEFIGTCFVFRHSFRRPLVHIWCTMYAPGGALYAAPKVELEIPIPHRPGLAVPASRHVVDLLPRRWPSGSSQGRCNPP